MDETLLNLLIDKDLASPGQALVSPGQALARPPGNRPLLLVILGPYAAAQAMLTLAAHLARRGPLQVLDGGNRFNAYIVARQLRRLGTSDISRPGYDLRRCLDRIRVARAFTCYQMAALIDQTMLNGSPTLVIDLLDTFYDESAPLAERRRLAEHCMQRLRQSILAPAQPDPVPVLPDLVPPVLREPAVVVSLRPPPPGQPDPTGLQELVQAAADYVLIQGESWHSQGGQLDLF
jgi:hypothetical protein